MARKNDCSFHVGDWTNAKLMRELNKYANLASFSSWPGYIGADGDSVRNHTKLYRESWLQPIIDEIEKRFVKVK